MQLVLVILTKLLPHPNLPQKGEGAGSENFQSPSRFGEGLFNSVYEIAYAKFRVG